MPSTDDLASTLARVSRNDPCDVFIGETYLASMATPQNAAIVVERLNGAKALEMIREYKRTILAPMSHDEPEAAKAIAHAILNDTATDPESERAILARQLLIALEPNENPDAA